MQARLDHLDKQVTHALRDDLVHLEVHNMPPFAQGNPATFFTAAQTYERQRGQIALNLSSQPQAVWVEILVHLPHTGQGPSGAEGS